MAFDKNSGAGLQAQFDADPQFQSLLQKFQATKSPMDWLNLTQYANTQANAGGNSNRYALQVDGQGNVQMMDRNNPLTSPATWGPIAVGGASLGLGLLASGGGSGAAAVPEIATTSVGPATGIAAPTAAGASAAGAAGATTATGSGMGLLDSILGTGKKASDAYSGVTDVLGNASKQSMAEDNTNSSLKLLLENAKLNRDKFALTAPGTRLKTSAVSNLLSNYTPSKLDWGPGGFTPGAGARGVQPTVTGGPAAAFANPSPDTKALSDQVMHDELMSQMSGGGTGPGRGGDLAMPDTANVGKTGTTSKITGGLALGTGILGALSKLRGVV